MNQDSENKTKLSRSKSPSWVEEIEESGCILSILTILGAVCVLVYQCFLWLMSGEWVPMSGQVVFEYILGPDNPFVQWLDNPQSWYGLNRIVQFLTGSLAFFLVLLSIAIFLVTDEIGKKITGRKF